MVPTDLRNLRAIECCVIPWLSIPRICAWSSGLATKYVSGIAELTAFVFRLACVSARLSQYANMIADGTDRLAQLTGDSMLCYSLVEHPQNLRLEFRLGDEIRFGHSGIVCSSFPLFEPYSIALQASAVKRPDPE